MTPPKIHSAIAVDDRTLEVEFAGGVKKRYDITPLLELEMFETLKNPALFKAMEVEQGGYAVVWGSEVDISENELWQKGENV